MAMIFWIFALLLFHNSEAFSECPSISKDISDESLVKREYSITYHNYPFNAFCEWSTPTETGYLTYIVFVDFWLQGASLSTQKCEYDNLTLTWMNLERDSKTLTVCGTKIPDPIVSSRDIKVIFKSDSSEGRFGFKLKFRYLWDTISNKELNKIVYGKQRTPTYDKVNLLGLRSNGSYLLLNTPYPEIKCEAGYPGLICALIFAGDNSSRVNTENGAAVFREEGTQLIKCSCGLVENERFFSPSWQVHIGSTAPITSLNQSNFVLNFSTDYRKAKIASIILDGNVLFISNNTMERKFSYNLESKINFNPIDFNGKMVLFQTENEWGREEKSFALNIQYDPKYIAINGLYGDIVTVDVGTNVNCTYKFKILEPNQITFITSEDKKFRIMKNQLVPSHGGNYVVTCRVQLVDVDLLSKVFHLKVVGKETQGGSGLLIALIASGSVNLILSGLVAAFFYRKYRSKPSELINNGEPKESEQKHEKLALMIKESEVIEPRELSTNIQ